MARKIVLTIPDVVAIYTSDQKAEYLAATYKCSVGAICNIWNGTCWKHVTTGLTRVHRDVKASGRPRSVNIEPKKETS